MAAPALVRGHGASYHARPVRGPLPVSAGRGEELAREWRAIAIVVAIPVGLSAVAVALNSNASDFVTVTVPFISAVLRGALARHPLVWAGIFLIGAPDVLRVDRFPAASEKFPLTRPTLGFMLILGGMAAALYGRAPDAFSPSGASGFAGTPPTTQPDG